MFQVNLIYDWKKNTAKPKYLKSPSLGIFYFYPKRNKLNFYKFICIHNLPSKACATNQNHMIDCNWVIFHFPAILLTTPTIFPADGKAASSKCLA